MPRSRRRRVFVHALLLPGILLPACRVGPGAAADPAARVLISGPILGPDGASICTSHPAARIRVLATDSTGHPVETSDSRCPTDNFFLVVPPGTYTLQIGGPPDSLTAQATSVARVEARRDVEVAVRVGVGK
ncbi:MAG: hypothetical protein KA180_13235 [Gemmatimonadales bacterium]|nr:hypothetical protein [Gemmatimonadales bacterium]